MSPGSAPGPAPPGGAEESTSSELPDLQADAYRAAIGQLTTGVTVVTSTGSEGPAGVTATAVCSLSLDPLLMLVCLDRGSRTLAATRESMRLAVNVLASHQQDVAAAFATKASHREKFETASHRDVGGLPILDGVVAWLSGEVLELVDGGDHVIAITAVRRAEALGGRPLVHHGAAYRALDR